MGLKLTLTGEEIPASPVFVEFLHAWVTGAPFHTGTWYDQEGEGLGQAENRFHDIQTKADAVVNHPEGRELVMRSYLYFKELLTGRIDKLRRLREYHFVFVVGIPRTGGTYLTKQFLRAGNIDYRTVPSALAHDGFPQLMQASFRRGKNAHTDSLLQLAEYFVMAEAYFAKHGTLKIDGKILVPKKFTTLLHDFHVVRALLGANASYIVTLRHPLAMIGSAAEKCGGYPKGRKFAIRGLIEKWAAEEWVMTGTKLEDVMQMDYLTVMLGYWQRYHYEMAVSGLPNMPGASIVTYGKETMERFMLDLYSEHGVKARPEAFKASEVADFTQKMEKEAARAMKQMDAVWESLGLSFPLADLQMKF